MTISRRSFITSILSATAASALPANPARSASVAKKMLWEDATIPYSLTQFLPGTKVPYMINGRPFKHPYEKHIREAIDQYNEKTNVHFIETETPSKTQFHLQFPYTGDGNETSSTSLSSLRKQIAQDGTRLVKIQQNKAIRALHELGHALGLVHEHQRSDRNSYIQFYNSEGDQTVPSGYNYKLLSDSCNGDVKRAFDNVDNIWFVESCLATGLLDYDTRATMHYWNTPGSYVIADKSGPAYRSDPDDVDDSDIRVKVGPLAQYLSGRDIAAVNTLYPDPPQQPQNQKPKFQKVRDRVKMRLIGTNTKRALPAVPTFLAATGAGWPDIWVPILIGPGRFLLRNPDRGVFLDAGPAQVSEKISLAKAHEDPWLFWDFQRAGQSYVVYNEKSDSYVRSAIDPRTIGAGSDIVNRDRFIRWRVHPAA